MKRFTLTEDHIKLLRAANITWNGCEFGAPAVDCKRPYGNSSPELDIAEILGLDVFKDRYGEWHLTSEQEEYINRIHRETQTALRIILVTGSFEPGGYVADEYRQNWRKDSG